MAKRFIDTSFFKSPFVRGLKGSLKSLYLFIICDCDGTGIWSPDLQIAGLFIDFQITQTDFDNNFLKTGKAIKLENGKYFFPDFIEHQYPKGLSEHNPAQKNFINELLKFGLINEDLQVVKRPFKDPSKELQSSIGNGLGNGNGKGNGIGNGKKEKNSNLIFPYSSPEFLEAWENLTDSKKWKNKTPNGLAMSLKKLAKENEADAIQMIENCIAGNWMGLVDLKPHQRTKTVESGLKEVATSYNEAKERIIARHMANG